MCPPSVPRIAQSVQDDEKKQTVKATGPREATSTEVSSRLFLHMKVSQNVLGYPNGDPGLVIPDMSAQKRKAIGLGMFVLVAVSLVMATTIGMSAVNLRQPTRHLRIRRPSGHPGRRGRSRR